jgi:hypothetical protein
LQQQEIIANNDTSTTKAIEISEMALYVVVLFYLLGSLSLQIPPEQSTQVLSMLPQLTHLPSLR